MRKHKLSSIATLTIAFVAFACVDEEIEISTPGARSSSPATRVYDNPNESTLPASNTEHPTLSDAVITTPPVEPPPESRCTSIDLIPVPQESLRLNDEQFENTIRSLFSHAVTIEPQLVSTNIVAESFTTFPDVNNILFDHAEDLVELSENLALVAIDNIENLLPCSPVDVGESECAQEFVSSFGQKAFRRPLNAEEGNAFMALYASAREGADPLSFDEAIGVLVQAIILSPQVMYMVEVGTSFDDGIVELTAYELASRLSYLYWNLPPDDILLEAAFDGSLLDDEVLRAQSIRLLDDPRGEAVFSFFSEWFGVAGLSFTDRVSSELSLAFSEEFERNVSHLVRNSGTLEDLLVFDRSFVNAPLAAHYGISPNPSSGANDWQRVELPDERRGGLMTTAAFAAASAHASDHTSIIHRGKLVREALLCGELGIPDPAFFDLNPVLPENATVREKIDARMEVNPCGDCHILMDPIGIGMEDIDQKGSFRNNYDNGQVVDVEGSALFVSGLEPAFEGVNALAHKLAPSETFASCASDQWLRYVVGRRDLGDLDCLVEALQEEHEALGGDLRAMMLAATSSDAFRYRRISEENP